MTEKLTTESTSLHTANVDPIVLRETKTTRLVFQPQLVDNVHNEQASVRGTFVFQRKSPADEWVSAETTPLSKLHKGEHVKLELHGEEVFTLVEGLRERYTLYEQCGIQTGVHEFQVVPAEVARVIQSILEDDEARRVLFDEKSGDLLRAIAVWASQAEDPAALARQLAGLEAEPLAHLHVAARVAELAQVLKVWDSEGGNDSEEFWQQFFIAHPWLLSSLFGGEPLIYAGERVYVGGQDITRKGGSYADFLYENGLTHCVAVVEIKTPLTPLLGAQYREGVRAPSQPLVGAISQVLSQRYGLLEDFDRLAGKHGLRPYGMRAVVVAGCLTTQDPGEDELRSFELFRRQQRDVEMVTFDELFEKAREMLSLVEAPEGEEAGDDDSTGWSDDIPF